MPGSPRVAVVIAAYQPGDGFDRVTASLDAQTLPQDQFETIVVDDGSPDDTFDRLQARAATRPNMRVERIENSGWPSRPRNIGTDLATAPYVFYMDHDDSLHPDALQRLVDYAAETGADVVSAKEAQTRSVWWGTSPFRHGNVANVVPAGDIHQLMPMIPHKLYRRAFLAEHGIRFPEGRRQLWEDIFFNIQAWRHARVIALLADTQVYLWHLTKANNSSTYGPGGTEFWDRMDLLLDFIDRTLDGEEFAQAHQDEVLHQWRSRALKRFAKLAGTADDDRPAIMLPRAQAVQARYIPEEVEPLLGMVSHPYSALTRSGSLDLLGELWRLDQGIAALFSASDVRWNEGLLEADVTAEWLGPDGKPLRLLERDGRILRDLPAGIAAALPPGSLDITDTFETFLLRVAVHSRTEHLTWDLPVTAATTVWEPLGPGIVTPISRGHVVVDLERANGSRPLAPSTWELTGMIQWGDISRSRGLRVKVKAMPALPAGGPAVAYTNKSGTLSIDLVGRARNVVAEGGLAGGRVQGTVGSFVLPLPKVQSWAEQRTPAAVRFETDPGGGHTVEGALVADARGVRLEGGGTVPPGRYRLAFLLPSGVDRTTRWSARVTRTGRLVLTDTKLQLQRSSVGTAKAEVRRILRGVRRRLRR